MLRNIEKDDVSFILDSLTEFRTFGNLEHHLGLPKKLLSDILKDLTFFGLIINENGRYIQNFENVQLWEKYNRELDYKVFAKSDNAVRIHDKHGLFVDVDDFSTLDLDEIEDEYGDEF